MLCMITFYVEDLEKNMVDCSGETKSITLLMKKIYV